MQTRFLIHGTHRKISKMEFLFFFYLTMRASLSTQFLMKTGSTAKWNINFQFEFRSVVGKKGQWFYYMSYDRISCSCSSQFIDIKPIMSLLNFIHYECWKKNERIYHLSSTRRPILSIYFYNIWKTNRIFVAVSFPTFCVDDWKTSSNNNNKKRNNHRVEHLIYWYPAETVRCEHQSLPPFKMYTAQNCRKKNSLWNMSGFCGFHYYGIYFRPFKMFTCCYAIHQFCKQKPILLNQSTMFLFLGFHKK